jgi:hypothetical protein
MYLWFCSIPRLYAPKVSGVINTVDCLDHETQEIYRIE